MSAVEKGYKAVADTLLPYVDEPTLREDLAKQLINTWSKTTNPVGLRPSETIYDEFYRLRAGARLALMAYDESRPIDDYMEALRSTLIALQAIDTHENLDLGGK